MKILPVNNLNRYNTRQNNKISQTSRLDVVQAQDSVSFQSRYKTNFLKNIERPIKEIYDCSIIKSTLTNSLVAEKNLSIYNEYYLNKDYKELLNIAKGVKSEIILAKSKDYNTPFITLDGGSICFKYPYDDNEGYSISMYLDGATVNLTRTNGKDNHMYEYFEFWDSTGALKEHSKYRNGVLCENLKYDRWGDRKRDFFDILFGN